MYVLVGFLCMDLIALMTGGRVVACLHRFVQQVCRLSHDFKCCCGEHSACCVFHEHPQVFVRFALCHVSAVMLLFCFRFSFLLIAAVKLLFVWVHLGPKAYHPLV